MWLVLGQAAVAVLAQVLVSELVSAPVQPRLLADSTAVRGATRSQR
jgi:hypothetical protein